MVMRLFFVSLDQRLDIMKNGVIVRRSRLLKIQIKKTREDLSLKGEST